MSANLISALVVLTLALQAATLSDLNYDYYCSKELSCGDIPNIMCNRTTKFPPTCIEPEYVPINDALMTLFLDEHNELRRRHAIGKTKGIFNGTTVADMATIQWDDELELMSLHNAVQCQMIDDKCHRTFNYKTVGQNKHVICEKPDHVSISGAVNEAMTTWFSEYKFVPSLDAIQQFGSAPADSPIKHFTQMVQSNADRIGCSIVRYIRKGKLKCTLIGCNYSVGNVKGLPVYKTGPPASECHSGENEQYSGLCRPTEEYTKHGNTQVLFTNSASPAVPEWVKSGKHISPKQ